MSLNFTDIPQIRAPRVVRSKHAQRGRNVAAVTAIAIALLTGCRESASPSAADHSAETAGRDSEGPKQQPHNAPLDSGKAGNATSESGAWKPSASFVQQAQEATVRIEVGPTGGVGSGVIVGARHAFTYVLTAGHVVGDAKRVRVTEFAARPELKPAAMHNSAEVLARDVAADFALVRFVTSRRPQPMLPVSAGFQHAKNHQLVSQNLLAVSIGEPDDMPRMTRVHATGPRRVLRSTRSQPAQVWQTDVSLEHGSSGGPLLDSAGNVVGIASGFALDRGYYGYSEALVKFLREAGYDWLVMPEKRPL